MPKKTTPSGRFRPSKDLLKNVHITITKMKGGQPRYVMVMFAALLEAIFAGDDTREQMLWSILRNEWATLRRTDVARTKWEEEPKVQPSESEGDLMAGLAQHFKAQ